MSVNRSTNFLVVPSARAYQFCLCSSLFRHIAVFIIVLGYGILRAIQISRSGQASMSTFAGDVLAVALMICVLLPSVVKIVAIERLKKRLVVHKTRAYK